MTTSFTTSDGFTNMEDEGFEDESQYPEAFGITFTPQVTGIVAGVGGLLVAAYLIWSQVLPVAGELGTLRKDQKEKNQLVKQLENLRVETKVQQKQVELEQIQDLKEQVRNLFAKPSTLDTLLLNINAFANATNIKLNSYTPNEKKLINDNSFGELAKEKVETQSYNLDIEGSFAQIQLFLQDLERLEPLLVVKEFNTTIVNETEQNYILDQKKVVVTGQPQLKSNITVDAVFVAPPPPPEETE